MKLKFPSKNTFYESFQKLRPAVSGVAGGHHVLGVEHLLGQLGDRQGPGGGGLELDIIQPGSSHTDITISKLVLQMY